LKSETFDDENFTSREIIEKSKIMDSSIAKMLIAESRSINGKAIWQPEHLMMKKELLRSIERDQVIMG